MFDIILILFGMLVAWFFIAPPRWVKRLRDTTFVKFPFLRSIARTDAD